VAAEARGSEALALGEVCVARGKDAAHAARDAFVLFFG
jgi:hypothetical protein